MAGSRPRFFNIQRNRFGTSPIIANGENIKALLGRGEAKEKFETEYAIDRAFFNSRLIVRYYQFSNEFNVGPLAMALLLDLELLLFICFNNIRLLKSNSFCAGL